MDTSGTHLWLVMNKAYRTLERHARRSIDPRDMCSSDFSILELLLHRGTQPVNAIGRRIHLTSGAITTAVDRLESRGLVARSFDPEDRRTRFVSLTPQGTARIREVFGHHKGAMDHAASGLTKTERETLINLIKKLGTTAEQQLTHEDEP
jgi:MarR family transcriptional regulator, 2-MHQ and catechol-resistance regulon repressor